MKIKKIAALTYARVKFKILSILSPRKAAAEAFTLFCTPEKSNSRKPPVFKTAIHLDENINGIPLKGYQWNKGKQVKVLILHGYSSRAYKFHRYIHPLVKKGYEVLAFDVQAHGGSGGKTVNAAEYRDMIGMILQKYGPVNRFIAHSFGGLAVCLALENIPHDENTKVVLIAPATETSTAIDLAFRILRIKNKKVRKYFDDIILKLSGLPTEWFSVNRAVKNMKASVLWIHDRDDTVTPYSDAEKVKEQNLPNVKFVTTVGLGHRHIYRDVSVKRMVFDFL